ncbi:MAG: hypothetical protein IKD46_08565, partial [Lentisphaeria bacterium]|nr:hypothetical protein [Lentisphaeria bacterium]
TCTDLYGRWAQGYVGAVCSGNSKAQGAEGGLLAGSAHCVKPILRAKNVGLVGQVGLVGRLALGAVSAMCSGNSKAHGCQRAMCQLSIMSIMSIMSIFTAPTHVHCVMRSARHITAGA